MKLLPGKSGPLSFLAWRCVWLSLVFLAGAAGLLALQVSTAFLPPVVGQNLIGLLVLAAWAWIAALAMYDRTRPGGTP